MHIRNRIADGPTWYNVPHGEVAAKAQDLFRRGVVWPSTVYFSGMAPHHRGTIQGELYQNTEHLWLEYNRCKLPMRDGFKVERLHAWGVMALGLLHYYLSPRSLDWLNYLLDAYPGHIIEFSAFDTEWGSVPGYNAVFWEVRLY